MRQYRGFTEDSMVSCLPCLLRDGALLSFLPSADAPLCFEQYFVQHPENTPSQNTCPEKELNKHLNSASQYRWKEKPVPENQVS